MNFIVDAQLPKALSAYFLKRGFNSIHTLDMPLKNATPDENIISLASSENRVVVTKDSDFFDSYILKKMPAKLLLVTTGNIQNKDLLKIFETSFDRIKNLLSEYDVVEIDSERITVHF
ncbi:MAG: DUF5615 family PIN-like protein [Bacteroidetes bacterium]|nr:DUF5615 family PIN-like protein [Bacteroidota bacterium]